MSKASFVSAHNKKDWPSTGNRYQQIEDAIRLKTVSIVELIEHRKRNGLPSNVLDLFGPGGNTGKAFMRKADSWTGIRLNPGINTHAEVLVADLFDPVARDSICLPVQPDIILCNPIGAFGLEGIRGLDYKDWSIFMQEFYSWAYSHLSSNYGLMFSELMSFVPDGIYYKAWPEMYRDMVSQYITGLRSQGVNVTVPALETDTDAMRSILFEKGPDSPHCLQFVEIDLQV
ncbi:MAG: hypothetical protein QY318_04825 [Candidatus Dojkabacteria bacterium]|nr:MAG: hypothetical protein QY318_04825 [Candidatus Dojkabacteria bacterium]